MKDVLGNIKGPIIPFCSLVEYHPIPAKDQSRIHQFGKKVLPGLFLGYALYAGGIWKGDVLIADLEELETMDASEIYSKRLNAKEVIFPQKGEFTFPIAEKTFPGIIVNGIAERAVRKIQEGTSVVLLQSGLDKRMVSRFRGVLLQNAKHI